MNLEKVYREMEKNSMEYGQGLEILKKQINESNDKIENLSYLIQNLANKNNTGNNSESFAESNLSDKVDRIETKLDILANTQQDEFIELFLSELKQSLEEKQSVVTSKILVLEKLNDQIINIINESAANTEIKDGLLLIKNEISLLAVNYNPH